MKPILLLFLFLLIACNGKYVSPYGYDQIKEYEYTEEPWDMDAMTNVLYSTWMSDRDSILYSEIEKHKFIQKGNIPPGPKLDSILFKGKYEYYIAQPTCPAGYNRILLLSEDEQLKYVVKFSAYCDKCFLIDYRSKKTSYLKIGYEDFMKLMKPKKP